MLETASMENTRVQYNGAIQFTDQTSEAEKTNLLLVDVMRQVFSYSSFDGLKSLAQVCHVWRALVKSGDEAAMRECAKGAVAWAEAGYGKVQVPRTPIGIAGALRDHYLKFGSRGKLFLMPETIGGRRVTLNKLVEFAKVKFGDGDYCSSVRDRHGTQFVKRSRWVLVAENALPDGCYKRVMDKIIAIKKLGSGYGRLLTGELVAAHLLELGLPWRASGGLVQSPDGSTFVVVVGRDTGAPLKVGVANLDSHFEVVAARKF